MIAAQVAGDEKHQQRAVVEYAVGVDVQIDEKQLAVVELEEVLQGSQQVHQQEGLEDVKEQCVPLEDDSSVAFVAMQTQILQQTVRLHWSLVRSEHPTRVGSAAEDERVLRYLDWRSWCQCAMEWDSQVPS